MISEDFTALVLEIKSLVTLCHWTIVTNILKECNAIKILGTTYTVTCARRLESSYPAYLYRVVVIISLCSGIFHLSLKHVHAAYVGMSIFRSQPEDQLICMMVFFFFSHSRQFVAECLQLAMSTSKFFPIHHLLTLYSETLTASVNKKKSMGISLLPPLIWPFCQLPI